MENEGFRMVAEAWSWVTKRAQQGGAAGGNGEPKSNEKHWKNNVFRLGAELRNIKEHTASVLVTKQATD